MAHSFKNLHDAAEFCWTLGQKTPLEGITAADLDKVSEIGHMLEHAAQASELLNDYVGE